jgi:DNA-binding transcriptional regulator YiaG
LTRGIQNRHDSILGIGFQQGNIGVTKRFEDPALFQMMQAAGKRIAALRRKANLSQKEMSERLEIGTMSQYARWEAGNRMVPPFAVLKMSRIFGVSMDYIYCGRNCSPCPAMSDKK